MLSHGLRYRATAVALSLLFAFGVQQARAGMFDDDEARRQINDLSIKVNEHVDTLTKAQIDLVNQIQLLRDENAKLRGLVETLNHEIESSKKRQQDFYIDLDDRLRRIEPSTLSASPSNTAPGEISPSEEGGANGGGTPPSNPAAESHEYESALNLLKANKLREAANAFGVFAKNYPDSSLTPNAYYWQGNALSALRECKKAIEIYRIVPTKWPQDPKAPDSLVSMALCQQELGDSRGAKASLETVVSKYPDSSAASTAQQRLRK